VTDFRLLETFIAVASLGSFRAAAARLNTTQPAVSQRIVQLEEQYGARLFVRSSRMVRLTPKGQAFVGFAERILRLNDDMRRSLADDTALRGAVRLGVSESIVHTWLPGFMGLLARQHPRLSLEIEVDTTPTLRERLLSQNIDLAFLLGPLTDPGVENLPLPALPLAVLASPRFHLPPPPVPAAALAAAPLITFARRTQPHAALRALLTRPDWPEPVIHASAALAPAVRLAVEGVAAAIIPPAVAAREIASGELVIVETDLVLPALRYAASWLRLNTASAAGAVAALAAAHAAGETPNDKQN
jgi:DNA-binding transcriptional LysR family regulator